MEDTIKKLKYYLYKMNKDKSKGIFWKFGVGGSDIIFSIYKHKIK